MKKCAAWSATKGPKPPAAEAELGPVDGEVAARRSGGAGSGSQREAERRPAHGGDDGDVQEQHRAVRRLVRAPSRRSACRKSARRWPKAEGDRGLKHRRHAAESGGHAAFPVAGRGGGEGGLPVAQRAADRRRRRRRPGGS